MSWILQRIKTDCRHYIGEKPCKFKTTCHSCVHYNPMGVRICVIKFGAAGDCLRTTPILREFENKYGCCHVTWVTDKVSYELLLNNPLIDKLLLIGWDTALELQAQKFDVLYNGDKVMAAAALAAKIDAKEKYGFTLTDTGSLSVFNDLGEEGLFLGLSDPFKFKKNTKPYQQTLFEMFDLPWQDQSYVLELTDEEKNIAAERLAEVGATKRPIIGLNTGAGAVFATKKWPAERFVALAKALKEKHDCTLVIMGGPAEKDRNDKILAELGGLAVDSGCNNPVRIFAGMVAGLDALVTSDTLAMHLGIAAGVPTVALFGPTTPIEVTLYGKGEKLTGQPDCAPCYKAVCNEEEQFACMKEITVEAVLEEVGKLL